jgi:DNA-binding IclR family transcriptional regulator
MVLNPYQARILAILIKGNRWMNTAEIRKLARMSWNTAYTYLNRFYELGWIYKKGNYWRANIKRRY